MTDFQSLRIALTQKEKEILSGEKGATLQKILTTVVLYGEALGAKKLVNITGKGHFVISHAIPGISPSLEMLDALIAAGLKTQYPFTVDPMAPLDYENWWLNPDQVKTLDRMYRDQKHYDEKMLQNLLQSYPVLWNTKNAKPEKCYLGCPHLNRQSRVCRQQQPGTLWKEPGEFNHLPSEDNGFHFKWCCLAAIGRIWCRSQGHVVFSANRSLGGRRLDRGRYMGQQTYNYSGSIRGCVS